MTEVEWLTTNDFYPLHSHLWHHARRRPRKYRLVGCNICRVICGHITDERFRTILDLAERYADDPQLGSQLRTACEETAPLFQAEQRLVLEACEPWMGYEDYDSNQVARAIAAAQDFLVERVNWHDVPPDDREAISHDTAHQANEVGARLLREIFGNPFRPVTFSPSWRTDTATTLARQMYESREFSAMPILADALQDAGCDSAELLNHLRDPNATHVRGCWALDLVLGKK